MAYCVSLLVLLRSIDIQTRFYYSTSTISTSVAQGVCTFCPDGAATITILLLTIDMTFCFYIHIGILVLRVWALRMLQFHEPG